MSKLIPIQTSFDGHRFRSRTEARYAVMFKSLGIKYSYELEGYEIFEVGRWLPDFFLSDLETWIEVKPFGPDVHTRQLCATLSVGSDIDVACVMGSPDENTDVHLFRGDFPWALSLPDFLGNFFSRDQVKGALTAARSARFEHGEAPQIPKQIDLPLFSVA